MKEYGLLKRFALTAAALFIIPACLIGQGTEFKAMADGKAASVVLLPESGEAATEAATDMIRVLSKMTGAGVELLAKPGDNPCIVIGLASQWEKTTGDKIPAEQLAKAGNESFLLKSSPKRLLILGKTSEGASHGAYTVLNDWGCRWYFPTKDWEVIPQKKDLKVTADGVQGPAMKVRILSNGAGLGASARLFKDWCRRNRLGSEYGQHGVSHTYANFVPKALFKEHPEYFAKVSKDGDRPGTEQNGEQPCTTNPQVVEMVKQSCLASLRRARDAGNVPRMISVSPNDGTPNMCRCENCIKAGTYGDCTLILANQVAETIAKEFPDTLVAFLAYGRASVPPVNTKANPQVLASVATNYNWKTSVPRLIDAWSKLAAHTTIYEYYAIGAHGSWRPDYNGPRIRDMALSLSSWSRMGIEGVNGEMCNDWGSSGHRLWAFTQLAWNPRLNPDALMDDFIRNCWGAAADPMRRYYQRWESGQDATPGALSLSVADLQNAAKLASASPDVLKRIDQLSVFLYWNTLKRKYEEAGSDEAAKGKIALEGDIIQYRMRDYLMVQLVGAIYRIDRPFPMGFNSSEAADIRKKLAEYLPAPASVTETKPSATSENLVPLGQAAEKPVAATAGTAPKTAYSLASYRFRAKKDETVEVRFESGNPAAGKPVQAAKGDGIEDAEKDPENAIGRFQLWSLGDKADNCEFVQEENPAGNGGTAIVKFKIPADGLYQINAKTKNSGIGVREDFCGRPYVVVADAFNRRDVLSLDAVNQGSPAVKGAPVSSYFIYVPKGTKSFLVKPLSAGQFEAVFVSPQTGEVLAKALVKNREEALIAVPAGKDASVWELRIMTQWGRFGLAGIPPFLSRSVQEMMVPAECLQK